MTAIGVHLFFLITLTADCSQNMFKTSHKCVLHAALIHFAAERSVIFEVNWTQCFLLIHNTKKVFKNQGNAVLVSSSSPPEDREVVETE